VAINNIVVVLPIVRCASVAGSNMARIYADVNQQMPRSYWDYDSVNITWGVLENYEVVRKIGRLSSPIEHVKGSY
jgi:casein kinase II subunit alpha